MSNRSPIPLRAGLVLGGVACFGLGATPGSAQESAQEIAELRLGRSGWTNPLETRYMRGPSLNVCDQGAFFVSGVPKVTTYASTGDSAGAPQQIIIGQSYVQFMIPQERRRWPLVMIHGSTHTGAALDATPDGRQGWFSYAVQHNLATFVMDQPGRGRSGFDQSVFHEAKVTGDFNLIPSISRITDDGAWTTWFGHIVDGENILDGRMIRHGDAGDPQPPEDPSNPSEAHGDYPPEYPIPPVPNSIDQRLEQRIRAIGPAPNSANNEYLALQYYKQLVPNGENTLPTSFCEACVPQQVSPANTWSARAIADLVQGLGGAILSPHSQSTSQVMHAVRILRERGQLHRVKGIIIPEGGGTSLEAAGLVPSDFDNIPFLLINGDYRPLTTREGNREHVALMNSSPTRTVGPALALDVEDPRFGGELNGTTHMMMLGTNNLKIFDFFLEWAGDNIENPMVEGSGCSE